FYLSESEVQELNFDIFPHWMKANILEVARDRARENGGRGHLRQIQLLQKLVFFMTSKVQCISHTIPNFQKALTKGLLGTIAEAEEKRASAGTPEQREFYEAVAEVLYGIVAYAKRLADAARHLAAGASDPEEKNELLELARICDRVPALPARSFREGLTTVWICWTAIHLENPNIGLSLGRLDQLLYGLYDRDIESGALTVEQAVELVCCLWLKIGDHVPAIPITGEKLFGGSGSNQAITLGGVDADGADAVNDLTYVMLRATELMKLRDPNLNARYFSGVHSDDYLKRICEVNIETGATPAIHNDRAVIRALMDKGDSLQEARDYGIVGCVEPVSNGRCYGHTAAILLNLTSVLELTLFNGRHRHTGLDRLISFESGTPNRFEDFKAAFQDQLRWMVDQTTDLNNFLGTIHQDVYPTPILSSLFEGPMDKGKDLIQGGAVINSSAATIIGLADVADSISAIQKHVFGERPAVSYGELIDAVQKDFVGYEALQTRLANPDKTPKFGNDDDAADANVTWLVETIDALFGAKANYRGGRYRVGYWTMTNHAGFGKLMGAMPNGRKARENFTSGITPVSGVTPDLVCALHSVSKQPARCLSGGVALNLKYTPEADRERMLADFIASVKGYFDDHQGNRDGGMEIQFNVLDREMLEDAFRHPDDYRELLVRVSGYTAYFKDLNRQMQKEIINRTQYNLSSGKMVPYPPFTLS
ncbi:MAG: pyruvate formate lyase family protein, partial [Desulfobacterales bacterium]